MNCAKQKLPFFKMECDFDFSHKRLLRLGNKSDLIDMMISLRRHKCEVR